MDTLDELTHLFRTASVGLAVLDRNLHFLRMNEWLATKAGKQVEEQIGRTFEEVFPVIAPQVVPRIRQVIDTKETVVDVEVAWPVTTELGVQKYWLASYHPLKDRDGTVLRISVVFQDISFHKQADEKLGSTQEYLDSILLNLPVGIAILEGPDFRYFRINHRLAEINGLSVEDHLDRPLAEVLPDAAPDIIPGLRRVLETGSRPVGPSSEAS